MEADERLDGEADVLAVVGDDGGGPRRRGGGRRRVGGRWRRRRRRGQPRGAGIGLAGLDHDLGRDRHIELDPPRRRPEAPRHRHPHPDEAAREGEFEAAARRQRETRRRGGLAEARPAARRGPARQVGEDVDPRLRPRDPRSDREGAAGPVEADERLQPRDIPRPRVEGRRRAAEAPELDRPGSPSGRRRRGREPRGPVGQTGELVERHPRLLGRRARRRGEGGAHADEVDEVAHARGPAGAPRVADAPFAAGESRHAAVRVQVRATHRPPAGRIGPGAAEGDEVAVHHDRAEVPAVVAGRPPSTRRGRPGRGDARSTRRPPRRRPRRRPPRARRRGRRGRARARLGRLRAFDTPGSRWRRPRAPSAAARRSARRSGRPRPRSRRSPRPPAAQGGGGARPARRRRRRRARGREVEARRRRPPLPRNGDPRGRRLVEAFEEVRPPNHHRVGPGGAGPRRDHRVDARGPDHRGGRERREHPFVGRPRAATLRIQRGPRRARSAHRGAAAAAGAERDGVRREAAEPRRVDGEGGPPKGPIPGREVERDLFGCDRAVADREQVPLPEGLPAHGDSNAAAAAELAPLHRGERGVRHDLDDAREVRLAPVG